jgi:hypothetical protein
MLIKLVKCIKALKIGVPKVFGGLWETAFIMPPFSAKKATGVVESQ